MAKKPVETETAETVAEVKPESKQEITIKEVTLGVSTINDHERRLTMLEAKIAELTK